MDHGFIQKKFNEKNLTTIFRKNNEELWEKSATELKSLEHYQSNSFLNYQNEYFKKNHNELSFIVFKNDKPLFLFPIFFNFEKNKLINFDEYLYLPKIEKKNNYKISDLLISLLEKVNAEIINPYDSKITKFKKISSFEILNINLESNFEKIFSNFRKSYKSLINKKLNDLKMQIIYKNECKEDWAEFRELHKLVAGRSTRSKETWNIQEQNIKNGNGLFINFKINNQLISGSFFDMTKKDMKYSLSVTHCDYFNYNCNHKAIAEAIKFGIKNNIQKIHLGNLRHKEKDKKLINIFFFKKGFGDKSNKVNIYKII